MIAIAQSINSLSPGECLPLHPRADMQVQDQGREGAEKRSRSAALAWDDATNGRAAQSY
jgi:hypothetical protein